MVAPYYSVERRRKSTAAQVVVVVGAVVSVRGCYCCCAGGAVWNPGRRWLGPLRTRWTARTRKREAVAQVLPKERAPVPPTTTATWLWKSALDTGRSCGVRGGCPHVAATRVVAGDGAAAARARAAVAVVDGAASSESHQYHQCHLHPHGSSVAAADKLLVHVKGVDLGRAGASTATNQGYPTVQVEAAAVALGKCLHLTPPTKPQSHCRRTTRRC